MLRCHSDAQHGVGLGQAGRAGLASGSPWPRCPTVTASVSLLPGSPAESRPPGGGQVHAGSPRGQLPREHGGQGEGADSWAAGFQGERLPCGVVSGRPSEVTVSPSPHICFLSPLLLQMATDAVAQRSTGAGAQGPQGPEWVLPGWTKEFVPLSSGGVPCLPLPEAPPSTVWPPSCVGRTC